MKIIIIIPAYNEEKRIEETLVEYTKYFDKLVKKKELDYEILVVINNTTDRTEEIVKKVKKKNKRLRYLNLIRGGKGYATIEGFKEAFKKKNNLIGFVDADMATSPEQYHRLIKSIRNYDGIIADRYLKDSKIYPPVTLSRLAARKLFNFVIKSLIFLPFEDTQCGAKLFKREALESSVPYLSMSQWAFDVDLLYTLKRKGFRIASCPTIWIDKEYSKINFWQAGPWMALAILRLRLMNSPLKFSVGVYDRITNRIRRFLLLNTK